MTISSTQPSRYCRDVLTELPDASVDAVVTDPPYELGFMGKGWDSSGIAYSVPMWSEVLRVLKPGGHLLAFGGTRTWHRMVVAIEDAGFEIRDELVWLYGSGFPKSLDVSKAIDKAAGAEREVVATVAHRGADSGGASRFFYVAKASTAERPKVDGVAHATVKPLELMRWLVRLVTPPGGLVLDPFAGTGTTAEACIVEGFRCVLIEKEADHLPLILARLAKPIQPTLLGGAS